MQANHAVLTSSPPYPQPLPICGDLDPTVPISAHQGLGGDAEAGCDRAPPALPVRPKILESRPTYPPNNLAHHKSYQVYFGVMLAKRLLSVMCELQLPSAIQS